MAVDQETVDRAGIGGDRFDARIGSLEKRQGRMLDESADLSKQQLGILGEEEKLIKARGEETAAPRAALVEKAKQLPETTVKEEPIPRYERPRLNPNDFKEAAGILMVGSLLMGVAGRSPFMSAMTALSGAMDGFTKRDDEIVAESMKAFDLNFKAIKERNDQKRRAVEDAWKKYANDLVGLKTELELIASKYDDPLALQAARSKSLTETQKLIDANVRSIDQGIARLEQIRANVENARARTAEANARIKQSEERLALAREAAAKRDQDLASRRFRDEKALREEYEKDSKPLQKESAEIDRILYYADHPKAFSDVQLRQAVSQFQKGARGTNAMIASMTNFGSLDERLAGHFTRFFDGTYEPEQRADIKNLFTGLRDRVVKPALSMTQDQFRLLARKHGFPENNVVMPAGGPAGIPTPDETPTVPVTVTPREQ